MLPPKPRNANQWWVAPRQQSQWPASWVGYPVALGRTKPSTHRTLATLEGKKSEHFWSIGGEQVTG